MPSSGGGVGSSGLLGLLLSAAAEHGEQRKGKEERKHTLHGQRLLTE